MAQVPHATPTAPETVATDVPRALVVGAGRISEEHLKFLARSTDARLVGVCDLDPVLAERAARTTPGAVAETDHRRAMEELRPDAVHITTWGPTHARLAADALEAGVRLVIVEKPAATSAAEADAMVRDAEVAGARVTEDQNYRFNSPTQELKRLVDTGVLGELREVEIRISTPLASRAASTPAEAERVAALAGGVVREWLPHLSYLARSFVPGAHVIDARWSKRDPGTPVDPDDLLALLATDDAGPRVWLRFCSGIAPATSSILARGDTGYAEADLLNPHVRVSRLRDAGPFAPIVDLAAGGATLVRAAGRGIGAKVRGVEIYSGIHGFLGATYAAYRSGDPLPVTHEDVVASARIFDDLVAPLA